ncbi:MAG: FKBP-type peptidyl-prolyl cis-trans isomerase [Bacteroidota bacterium]
MRIIIPFLLISCLIFGACEEEATFDALKQAETDRELILEYIAENNLNATEDSTGVWYVIDAPGSISRPEPASIITINYRGILLNGEEFDSTYGDNEGDVGTPIRLPLNSTIPGWQVGIPKFKKGGKGTLIIPSGFGYGRTRTGNIPSNSVLVFEKLELVDID